MLLEKQAQITIFRLDNNGTFESVGQINQFTSLIWPDRFNGYATFELRAPVNDENTAYLKRGNIVWCGGDNAARIEIVDAANGENGMKTYHVKGRTLEQLLTTRILWDMYAATGISSTIMYDIVNKNCVNPTDVKRKIPFLELANDDAVGRVITYQKTGGSVYDSIESIASSEDIGFDILFRPREKKLIFKVTCGKDRTVNQNLLEPVEFSTDLEGILSSEYHANEQDVKNVALIAGEDSSTARKKNTAGDITLSGLERKELYVDARDLQSVVYLNDGTSVNVSEAEYSEMLKQRGEEKLSENRLSETFESKVRAIGQYEYGCDYQKGDKVTIFDSVLDVLVSARITEVEEAFSKEYSLTLTLGYSYPTIAQKIKRI